MNATKTSFCSLLLPTRSPRSRCIPQEPGNGWTFDRNHRHCAYHSLFGYGRVVDHRPDSFRERRIHHSLGCTSVTVATVLVTSSHVGRNRGSTMSLVRQARMLQSSLGPRLVKLIGVLSKCSGLRIACPRPALEPKHASPSLEIARLSSLGSGKMFPHRIECCVQCSAARW